MRIAMPLKTLSTLHASRLRASLRFMVLIAEAVIAEYIFEPFFKTDSRVQFMLLSELFETLGKARFDQSKGWRRRSASTYLNLLLFVPRLELRTTRKLFCV